MPVTAINHPNVEFYSIGKGELEWTPTGGTQRSLGNAPEIELTPEVEKLDHYSSLSGVKSKDKSVVVESKLMLRVVLDEISAENLKLLLMGGALTNVSAGKHTFAPLAASEIQGAIDFTGSNTVGSKIDLSLPKVSFTPSGSLNLVSDEWNQIELEGEVLLSSGTYGTITVTEKTTGTV